MCSQFHAARLERLSFLREAMPSKKIIAEDGKAAIKNKYYIACGIIKYLFE